MIESFANKTAIEIWEFDSAKQLPEKLHVRAKALLTIMNSSASLEDLRLKGQPPNIRLHKLKGARKNEWSVTIRLPWCITFEFRNGGFYDVKIENYHKG